MIWVNPTYAVAEILKKIQIWKYENNLKAFEYVFIRYEAKQKNIALCPRYVPETKSMNSPVKNASKGPIFTSDLYK